MDCGSGTLGRLATFGLDWSGVTHVLLSHFHTDHVGELAPLLFALKHAPVPRRTNPLVVLGPEGLTDFLERLAQAHGGFVLDPGFPLSIVELPSNGSWTDPADGFRLYTLDTPHTDPSLAFRLEVQGAVLGYTGDTGPAQTLGGFFSGVDLLVAECSHPDDQAQPNHLSPTSLAALATTARPGLLVPVHVYPPLRPEQLPGLIQGAGFHGPVTPGRDGWMATVRPGRVEVDAT